MRMSLLGSPGVCGQTTASIVAQCCIHRLMMRRDDLSGEIVGRGCSRNEVVGTAFGR